MPEIGTSGLMSGNGKRGGLNVSTRAHPRLYRVAFHVEHIVPKQHGGSDDSASLSLACDRCNVYKGPNLTSVDPDTGALVPLFHPRKDSWDDRFMSREGYVLGVMPVGRATIRLLNMPPPRRVELRQATGSTSG